VERFRSVRITIESGSSGGARLNVFQLVDSLYGHHRDDDLRRMARKFPVADFWAHSRYSQIQDPILPPQVTL
jgi:hypothetical protein